jgi:HSP20 family protein
MTERKANLPVPVAARDPFALLREMATELDRAFEHWPTFRWPAFEAAKRELWTPRIDVFERDNRLVTRVDLPGVKKEDVTVEAADGYLTLRGERKHETEEKKDNVFRSEREYGTFYRAVPLPAGAKLEDVEATFNEGVLEVSVPLPVPPERKARKVEIVEPKKAEKTAA